MRICMEMGHMSERLLTLPFLADSSHRWYNVILGTGSKSLRGIEG